MYQKMQESELTEPFPSYASQLSGPVFLCDSHSEFLGAHCREWLQSDGCQTGRYCSSSWVPSGLRNSLLEGWNP